MRTLTYGGFENKIKSCYEGPVPDKPMIGFTKLLLYAALKGDYDKDIEKVNESTWSRIRNNSKPLKDKIIKKYDTQSQPGIRRQVASYFKENLLKYISEKNQEDLLESFIDLIYTDMADEESEAEHDEKIEKLCEFADIETMPEFLADVFIYCINHSGKNCIVEMRTARAENTKPGSDVADSNQKIPLYEDGRMENIVWSEESVGGIRVGLKLRDIEPDIKKGGYKNIEDVSSRMEISFKKKDEYTWHKSLDAKIGDTVECQICYKKLGEASNQRIFFHAKLPESLIFDSGTIVVARTDLPYGIMLEDSRISIGGIFINNYRFESNYRYEGAGEPVIRFKVYINGHSFTAGLNKITVSGNITVERYAGNLTDKDWIGIGSDAAEITVQIDN